MFPVNAGGSFNVNCCKNKQRRLETGELNEFPQGIEQ